MKKIILSLMFAATAASLASCEESDRLTGGDLTDEEIVEGLKTALIIGTDTASAQLSATNGYYHDLAVKILLPVELQASIQKFKNKNISLGFTSVSGEDLWDGYPTLGINGLKLKEQELIMGINRAAENAASTAGPIFVDAIADISIEDGREILFGNNVHAATDYLELKASAHLYNEYEPKMDAALASVKIGNASVVDYYESFVQDYNAVLNTSVGMGTIGSLMGINPVQASDLSEYSTQKGLDGLFLKISEEEEDIRKNPLARVNAILSKVFGNLN